MTFNKGKEKKKVSFKYTQDHSKWAISSDNKNYVCIADLNRMTSQEKRGGGAVCFKSPDVADAFDSIIAKTSKSEKKGKRKKKKRKKNKKKKKVNKTIRSVIKRRNAETKKIYSRNIKK